MKTILLVIMMITTVFIITESGCLAAGERHCSMLKSYSWPSACLLACTTCTRSGVPTWT
jgi:hypothetical protein